MSLDYETGVSDQVFYPSLVVNFRLLFDESLVVDEQETVPLPQRSSGLLDYVEGIFTPTVRPLVTSRGNANFSFVLNRVPRTASVELPGYRTAGKFSIEIDWRELPIDPRLIRVAAVEIYAGAVDPKDFSTGMVKMEDDGTRKSIMSVTDDDGRTRDDLMLLTGLVDNWAIERSDSSTIKLEGRDLRGILLDSPIDPAVAAKIDLRRNIIQVVHDIMIAHPASQYLYIVWNPNDWPDQTPPPVADPEDLTRVRRSASGDKPSGGTQASDQVNFWDLITQYCQPGDALVWREDLTWGPISEVRQGDRLMGFDRDPSGDKLRSFRKYAVAEVENVSVRRSQVVALHMESGRVVRCTADHRWFTGRSETDYSFMPPKVGRPLVRVTDAPVKPFAPDDDYRLGYVRGIIDGDITVAMNDRAALGRYVEFCRHLGLSPHEGMRRDRLVLADEPTSASYIKGWLGGMFDAEGCTSNGLELGQDREVNGAIYEKLSQRLCSLGFDVAEYPDRVRVRGGSREVLRFFHVVQPAAVFKFSKYLLGMKMSGAEDRVVKIEQCGEEDVYSLQTSTGTYFGQGYASSNCYLVGAVPYFRGRFLVIRPAKSIFDQTKPTGQSPAGAGAQALKFSAAQPDVTSPKSTWDPVFATDVRLDDDGKEFAVRKFIYGRNVKKLSFERKFTGVKVPVIQVVSYDTSSKNRGMSKLLTAEWPPQSEVAARTTSVSSSGDVSQTDVRRISVPGIRDQSVLLEIAKNLYEEIGRGEMGGSCETGFLASFKGDNSDPDILRLRPGHAVDFAMDARQLSSLAPAASSELHLERMGFEEAVKAIQIQLGTPDENLARVLVASMRSAVVGQLQQFRTANVKFDWSVNAMRISFDFQNYFTPRAAVTPTTGANTKPSAQTPIARTPRTTARGQVPPTKRPR